MLLLCLQALTQGTDHTPSSFPPGDPGTHLPTGDSQCLHEGLDAHALVVVHQLGQRGVRPVLTQDDVASVGLHLDHVVPAAPFAPGERDGHKQSRHGGPGLSEPGPCFLHPWSSEASCDQDPQ